MLAKEHQMVHSGAGSILVVPQIREFLLLLINLHLLRKELIMKLKLMNELWHLLAMFLLEELFVLLVRTKAHMDKFTPL